MASDTTLIVATRSLERLAIVGAGVLCIWFGFELFQSVPIDNSTVNASMGTYSLNVTKVAPGVFFAAFGVLLLWQSLRAAVSIKLPTDDKTGAAGNPVVFYSRTAVDPMVAPLAQARHDLAVLNAMASKPPQELTAADVAMAVHSARAAILGQVWDPAWGDAQSYRRLSEHSEIPEQGPVHDLYYAK